MTQPLTTPPAAPPSAEELAGWVRDARRRTLALIEDLSDHQLSVPLLAIINPFLWEIGHVAWFEEKWVLRHAAGLPPVDGRVDALYDSAAIAHDSRWSLPLPSRKETLDYVRRVEERVLARLEQEPGEEERYFVQLAVFHEDMHGEAFLYTRQTLGYPVPELGVRRPAKASAAGGPLPGDVEIPGGVFQLGAARGEPFVFDNEKWQHPVTVAPFRIARAPVTQGELAELVDDGGYRRRELWSDEGWRWRQEARADGPLYWRREGDGWLRRDFDRWVELEPHRPMIHVNWHEAQAFCRWAGRRLPSEAEWELAAAAVPGAGGTWSPEEKRRFPWGGEPPAAGAANLDGIALGCVDVGACPDGDSGYGCRQMIGNVWEWTGSTFGPYPGFEVDPYKEYSQPWFGTHKVLRGGAWPTRARMLRNTWRNYYPPHRRDVWAGFRTCAADRP